MSDFTQPLCLDCWNKEQPGRRPHRLKGPPEEKCCMCGNKTVMGIYIRRDPDTVPYPTRGGG